MRLELHRLIEVHPKLRGHPIDLSRLGALALQRARHQSPVPARVVHDGAEAVATLEWLVENLATAEIVDANRLTEDGAEAVALAYAHAKAGWVVKRRLQRGESADWLLIDGQGALALEVSGTASGDAFARLEDKRSQIARCTIPADRLAVVVAFEQPMIVASSV